MNFLLATESKYLDPNSGIIGFSRKYAKSTSDDDEYFYNPT